MPINCAAIPAEILESELFGHTRGAFTGAAQDRVGKFETAHAGTIFLDELTEMPLAMQAKLLRVLQEHEIERIGSNRRIRVDIRVIVATNRDARQAVQDGLLREDLFYRINVFTLDMPPLRNRRDDMALLVDHFLAKHGAKLGRAELSVTQRALHALQEYAWPGNIRELENILERAIVLSREGPLDVHHLPHEIVSPSDMPPNIDMHTSFLPAQPLPQAVEQLEKALIEQALTHSGGNKAKAARALDISERTLWYKVKKYGLS